MMSFISDLAGEFEHPSKGVDGLPVLNAHLMGCSLRNSSVSIALSFVAADKLPNTFCFTVSNVLCGLSMMLDQFVTTADRRRKSIISAGIRPVASMSSSLGLANKFGVALSFLLMALVDSTLQVAERAS